MYTVRVVAVALVSYFGPCSDPPRRMESRRSLVRSVMLLSKPLLFFGLQLLAYPLLQLWIKKLVRSQLQRRISVHGTESL